jgi:hypothetical protein
LENALALRKNSKKSKKHGYLNFMVGIVDKVWSAEVNSKLP